MYALLSKILVILFTQNISLKKTVYKKGVFAKIETKRIKTI